MTIYKYLTVEEYDKMFPGNMLNRKAINKPLYYMYPENNIKNIYPIYKYEQEQKLLLDGGEYIYGIYERRRFAMVDHKTLIEKLDFSIPKTNSKK
jgi:hypothetical protein